MNRQNRNWIWTAAATLMLAGGALNASATAQVGQAAPDFTLTASDGESYTLSDLQGKRVILEWTNHDCPYVRKHYGSGNMQALQQTATDEGYVWLSIISSASGKQGHVDAAQANALTEKRNALPTAVLFDESGEVGKAYGARTTPHMYVIDTDGTLLYAGGIDDKPTANPADIDVATNYVVQAMSELAAGDQLSVTTSRPYGCSVKYK